MKFNVSKFSRAAANVFAYGCFSVVMVQSAVASNDDSSDRPILRGGVTYTEGGPISEMKALWKCLKGLRTAVQVPPEIERVAEECRQYRARISSTEPHGSECWGDLEEAEAELRSAETLRLELKGPTMRQPHDVHQAMHKQRREHEKAASQATSRGLDCIQAAANQNRLPGSVPVPMAALGRTKPTPRPDYPKLPPDGGAYQPGVQQNRSPPPSTSTKPSAKDSSSPCKAAQTSPESSTHSSADASSSFWRGTPHYGPAPAAFVRGLVDEFATCGKGFFGGMVEGAETFQCAGELFQQGKFNEAVTVLDEAFGAATMVRAFTENHLKDLFMPLAAKSGDPHALGKRLAHTICLWTPAASKLVGKVPKPTVPLRGSTILANAKNLTGKFIELPPTVEGIQFGPFRLGKKQNPPVKVGYRIDKGEGKSGVVYEVVGTNGKTAIKLLTDASEEHAILGQALGHDLLNKAKIPQTKIFASRQSTNGNPSFALMENISENRWRGKNAVTGSEVLSTGSFNPEHVAAMRALYKEIGDAGLVWVDGHANNVFFFKEKNFFGRESGPLKAGVLDHDFIAKASSLMTSDPFADNLTGRVIWRTRGLLEGPLPSSPREYAQAIMDAQFQSLEERFSKIKPTAQ